MGISADIAATVSAGASSNADPSGVWNRRGIDSNFDRVVACNEVIPAHRAEHWFFLGADVVGELASGVEPTARWRVDR